MGISILSNQSINHFTSEINKADHVSANAGVEHLSNNYGLTANAAVQRSQTGNIYQISAKTSGQTGGLYWTSKTNSHTSEILNKTTQINQINPLRLDPNLQELRDYIGNRTLLNVESGGVLSTTNNNNINTDVGIGYGNKIGGGVLVNKNIYSGDLFQNKSYNAGLGFGAGVNGIGPNIEATMGYMNGKTSDHGNGAAFGFRVSAITGPELVADWKFDRNGIRYTIPFGGLVSNIATGNIVGLVNNLYKMVSGETLPIPRHEVIYPDDKPQRTPKIQMFEKNSIQLTEAGIQSVMEVVSNIKNNPSAKLELGQYEDKKSMVARWFENKEKTHELVGKRAETIKDMLIQLGVNPDVIKIGHSDIQQNSTKLTVEDHNTNIRYISTHDNDKLALNDGSRFNTIRHSPAGDVAFENIKMNPEFKELTKDKSKIEVESAANMVFDKMYISQPNIFQEQVLKEIKSFYDKGQTFTQALSVLDDKQTIASIMKNDDFNQFVQQNKINNNESKLLASYILEVTDFGNSDRSLETKRFNGKAPTNLVESLAQYKQEFYDKNISLENLEQTKQEFDKMLEKNPVYQNAIVKNNPYDQSLVNSYLFREYLSGNEKHIATSINMGMEQLNQNYYQQGKSLSFEAYLRNPNDHSNGYYQKRINEIKHDLGDNKALDNMFKSNDFQNSVKTYATENSLSVNNATNKEKVVVKKTIENLLLKSPNQKVDDVVNMLSEDVYSKGMTYNKFYQKMILGESTIVETNKIPYPNENISTNKMETEVLEKTNITKEIDQSEKTEKKSLWDYAVELAKKPLCTIDEEDRELIYGPNMWTRLMQQEERL